MPESPPSYDGVPDEEVNSADLLAELERRQKNNQAREAVEIERRVALEEKRIIALRIQDLNAKSFTADEAIGEHDKYLEISPSLDCSVVTSQLQTADETNRAVRAKLAYNKLWKELQAFTRAAEELTGIIKEVDATKAELVAGATFPVPGIGFDENGVTYNGIPFDQSSTAEQIRVSMAVGLAMNPKLKIVLIRDGSHLDEDSLAQVAQMAEDAAAQVWIERVGDGDEGAIIIEDGEVAASGGSAHDGAE